MAKRSDSATDTVVVLYKGGRLPTWHLLTDTERADYEQQHVDLMLRVARDHGLIGMEGHRLLAPQQAWERFWTIEFPDLAGAEAWIEAEMAPPYGSFGYYEYYLSRRFEPEFYASWVPNPPPPTAPPAGNPRQVPFLDVDRGSMVMVMFARMAPGADRATAETRGDAEHIERMRALAREYDLMRFEAYALLGPQPDWHRAWVAELPTLAGAEAWIQGEVAPPHGAYATKLFQLARRWAPDYFALWSAAAQDAAPTRLPPPS